MLSWATLPVALSGLLARLDAITITGVRFVVSTAVLAAALTVGRSRPALSRLGRSGLFLLAVATFFLAVNYLTYILGLAYTTPADAQVLIQAAPLLLALSGVFVFREPFARLQWLGFAVLIAGLGIFSAGRFGADVLDRERHLLGNGMIAVAAVTWAIYGMAQKQLLRVLPSQHIMLCIYLGCSALFLPLATFSSLARLDGTGWALLLFCALNTVVAYGSFAEALQHWEASRVSAVLALVPMATLGFQRLCVLVFPGFDPGPPLDGFSVAGAFTVVAGSLLTSLGARTAAPVLAESSPAAGA